MTSTATLPDPAQLRARVGDLRSLPGGDLIDIKRQIVQLRREADVLLAQVAAEIGRRSTPDDGAAGIARRRGFRSPEGLVADTTGGSFAEAGRLVSMGVLLNEADAAASGGDAPPRDRDGQNAGAGATPDAAIDPPVAFPEIARALREHSLSLDAAHVLRRALGKHPEVSGADGPHSLLGRQPLAQVEMQAVAKAQQLDLAGVRRLALKLEADLAPRDWAERHEQMRESRAVRLRDEPDGMVTLHASLDPETAAPIKAAIDGYVRQAMHARTDQDADTRDSRSAWQMRADALAWLAGHAHGCEAGHNGVKTTVVVRMGLEDLRRFERDSKDADGPARDNEAHACGTIDGIAQPVNVGVLRRMAADAEVIPLVLGNESEPLDFGRGRRLFSRAQRLALLERDGGCARCHAPPSYCDAHHIRWWERDAGPTDLNNGVMLCVSCHHRIHRDNWEIKVENGEVWFTPPRTVDPSRQPQLGGRAAIEVSAPPSGQEAMSGSRPS